MFHLLKSCLVCLLLAGSGGFLLLAQSPPTPEPNAATLENELLRSFASEEKKGDSFFYTQSYYALHGQHVFFKGSIYASVANVKVAGCTLTIDTTIADYYTGTIGKKRIAPTQNVYRISVDFLLTPEISRSLRVIKARPGQLDEGTHPVCVDHQPCVLNWIELSSDRPELRVAETTNDYEGYDGFVKSFDATVDRFLVPVSSPAAGNDLISLLQAFAGACAR